MSKPGRNDLCYCGSGKKYKNCHWSIDQGSTQDSNSDSHNSDLNGLEAFLNEYDPVQIIGLLAGLQVVPINHGKNIRFERMARLALLSMSDNKERKKAYFDQLKEVIENYTSDAHMEDEPSSGFTENIVFKGGNYIVFPGIVSYGSMFLNQLIGCIFLMNNSLPEEFKKRVGDAIGLLIFLSENVASRLNYERNRFDKNVSKNIFVPDYDACISLIDAITFPKKYVAEACSNRNIEYSIVEDFLVDISSQLLNDEDPDNNIVLRRPLFEKGNEIILYMPTAVLESLVRFIYEKAEQYACLIQTIDLVHQRQFHLAKASLENMNWHETGIELPPMEKLLPIRESVFRFDNQKLGYLCYIEFATRPMPQTEKPNFNFPKEIKDRWEKIEKFLSSLERRQTYEVLGLFVMAETSHEGFFLLPNAGIGNYTISFKLTELDAVSIKDKGNPLALWKFAKIFGKTSEVFRINSMGGMIDSYAIYKSNSESLMHADEENPIGGQMFITVGSGNDLLREMHLEKDEHAVPIFLRDKLMFAQVRRYKDYAPIYIEDEISKELRIVIESYKMPIWITNYKEETEKHPRVWARMICEGIAFWLHQLKTHIESYINQLNLVQFEIEVIIDDRLTTQTELEEKEIQVEDVKLSTKIEAPRIQVNIPFEFLYLVKRTDNTADKTLIKAVLKGLEDYIQEAGKKISWDDAIVNHAIEIVLQPSNAKMFLFSDASANVYFDTRGLLPMNYIPEADVSYILDNLTKNIPDGSKISKVISSPQEKKKLCNQIVEILLKQIGEKILFFNGKELLKWLITLNETCVHKREFNEIRIPARIACFSNIENELKRLDEKGENLMATSLATRCLIELVAANPGKGIRWTNQDDIDELLALVSQLTAWASLSDAIYFKITDPEMGLLPSGRIGTEKTLEREALEPFSHARNSGKLFSDIENFQRNYSSSANNITGKGKAKEGEELDEAFLDEFGITLTNLFKVVGGLIDEGFQNGEACVQREEKTLVETLAVKVPELSAKEIYHCLGMMTMIERKNLSKAATGFELHEIFLWRYKRKLSYMIRPLIKLTEADKAEYLYGYRQLKAYSDYLLFLLFSSQLPDPKSEKMKQWLGSVSSDKGAPFRHKVMDWLKNHTNLEVIDYEVKISPNGLLKAQRDFGDIDILAFDHLKKITYSIECKNIEGGRNVYEMWSEIGAYLGDDENDKAKIKMHYKRHIWLEENKSEISRINRSADEYEIRSMVITPDEIPLAYLKKHELPIPIRSFTSIRQGGF